MHAVDAQHQMLGVYKKFTDRILKEYSNEVKKNALDSIETTPQQSE